MAKKKRLGLLVRGKILNENKNWEDWTHYCESIFNKLGFEMTHIGATGVKFTSGKYLVYSRAKSRLLDAFKEGSYFEDMTFKCLPTNFHTAISDYEFALGRFDEAYGDPAYVYASFPDNDDKWERVASEIYECFVSFIELESAFLIEHLKSEHLLNILSKQESEFDGYKIVKKYN